MVPHGGIEYMAGGTGSHPQIGREPWSAAQKQKQHQKQEQKQNRWEEERQNQPQPQPRAVVCLTTPISSYTAGSRY